MVFCAHFWIVELQSDCEPYMYMVRSWCYIVVEKFPVVLGYTSMISTTTTHTHIRDDFGANKGHDYLHTFALAPEYALMVHGY